MKYPIGIQSFDRIIEDGVDLFAGQGGNNLFSEPPAAFRKEFVAIHVEKLLSGKERIVQGTGDRCLGKGLADVSCVPHRFQRA